MYVTGWKSLTSPHSTQKKEKRKRKEKKKSRRKKKGGEGKASKARERNNPVEIQSMSQTRLTEWFGEIVCQHLF